jgi:hypothetical protein
VEKWSSKKSAFGSQGHARSSSQCTVASSSNAKMIDLSYTASRLGTPPYQHRRSLHTSRRLLEEGSQGRLRKTESVGVTSTSQPIQKSETSETASASNSSSSTSDKTDNQVPKSPKDVSLGEVRRLMSLAKPEKRTLYTALGLVSEFLL